MATTPTYRPFQGLVRGSVLNTPFSLGTSRNSRAFHLPRKTDHPLSDDVNPLRSWVGNPNVSFSKMPVPPKAAISVSLGFAF